MERQVDPPWDAVVVGAGAAGLFCAGIAGQRGLKVLLLDHAPKVAEKIRISGGGRCNFTNLEAGPANFLSDNPPFCRSALARYTPADFLALLRRHRIAWHEKHRGQLFCDDSSDAIISMLLRECGAGGVTRRQPCAVRSVRACDGGYELDTDAGVQRTRALVVATGGLSIPKIGASDFGYRLAHQFGHTVVPTRPALVPLSFDAAAWGPYSALSGLSLAVGIASGGGRFDEDLLFTHRGLSGPAVLQISSYWRPGGTIEIDLAPGLDLRTAKVQTRRQLGTELARHLPQRLAEAWICLHALPAERPLPDWRDRDLDDVAAGLRRWTLVPAGSAGYAKAEVTAGGVDTRELSSRTFESRRAPGLYFIGEVLDVTGWLGGYNFQWAWASAAACAQALPA